MSRVLVTGGAGTLGTAIVRRLLADPAYDVRVSDARAAPLWMREGCELHTGDLRLPAQARAATKGCAHVIHVAGARDEIAGAGGRPHTTIEFENALHGALVRAALEREVERFLYISSPLVFERAELFPTPEQHLGQCPPPRSASGYARLSGERCCEAANEEHGLRYAICRPFGAYGPPAADEPEAELAGLLSGLFDAALDGRPPGLSTLTQRTYTPTHVDDIAVAAVLALDSPAALNEDFNLGAERELAPAELARIVFEACKADPGPLPEVDPGRLPEAGPGALPEAGPGVLPEAGPGALPGVGPPTHESGGDRSWPSVQKARERLGWQAQIDVETGIAGIVPAMRERHAARRATAAA
jgi:UDP-glucose 4-epimerase